MVMDYIKLDCPKCKKIHTLILKSDYVCKCPSCLREYKTHVLIENQLIKRGIEYN